MKAGSVSLSVVIAARDEEAEIADCVRSVAWAAEVLVVENDSHDDTAARAAAAGALVFSHPFTTIGGQRNAAIASARHPWVLVLDADERGTEGLGREIGDLLASGPLESAFRVRRRNFFLGREIRHGGWERDRPVRLFRATCRYDDRVVHERVVHEGPARLLVERVLHTPYATLDEYLEKLRRYAAWWGRQHHARGRRAHWWDLVLRPPARLATMLVLRGGWRDGMRGVLLAVLAAISVAAKYGHLWARGASNDMPD